MKKATLFLVIILCLAIFVLPGISAKEDTGSRSDDTVTVTPTPSIGETERRHGTDDTVTVTPTPSIGETERRHGTDDTVTVTPTPSIGETERRHGADDTVTVTPAVQETPEAGEQGTASEIGDSGKKSGRSLSDVRKDLSTRFENLNATLLNISSGEREKIKNENEVRIAVNTLLEMEDLSGGIGRNVSAIARDFNNSASSTRKIEDRIEARNSFIRILFGGDRDAARELANLTVQNRERIRNLQHLIQNASLDGQVRIMMEDQLRILEKEQVRLDQLSKREQEDRGFFGWLG